MLDCKEKILIELQDVLRVKNYKKEINEEIKKLLLEILELDIKNKENHIHSIIEGIKKFDTFEIGTREELLKIDGIKDNLSSTTFGFVWLPKKTIAIVEDEHEQATLYHELVHTTQNQYSYNVDEKYGISIIIKKAMEEGEAISREMELNKKKFPNTYKQSGASRIIFSYHSNLYLIYLEFYQDMKNILGEDLIEEWKKIDSKDLDIIPKFEQYMQKKYGCSISKVFNLWSNLLYHATLKDGKEKDINNANADLKNREFCYANNKIHFDEVCIEEMEINKRLININKDISKIDNILSDDDILNKEFSLIRKQQEKELKEYILEYGNDDVSKEWQDDIDSMKVDDYKTSLINDKNNLFNEYKEKSDGLNRISQKKQNLEWLDSFYLPTTNYDFTSLVIVKEKELSKILNGDTDSYKKADIPSSFFISMEVPKKESSAKKR